MATGLAASLPVVVAVIAALDRRWMPLADDGVIMLRSWDVFTAQSPLVGQYSIATAEEVGKVYSPGPLLYWLLAVPVRAFGSDAVPVTIGLLNVASISGAVALARRRGGLVFMFATAVAIALMSRSLPPEVLYSPLNATVPILPGLLLIFLCWSLACGELALLPLTVLVASFVTQSHLSFVPPTAGLLAIALAGLLYRRPQASGRWVLAAVLVGLACWSAPLADQLVHEPGNLVRLARTASADRPTVGADDAWHAVVRAFGARPWWLEAEVGAGRRFADVTTPPERISSISLVLIACGLLGAGVVGVRRRRVDVAAAAAAGLALMGAFAVVTAATPVERVISLGLTMQWGSPAGMFAWLALGFGALTLLGRALPRAVPRIVAAPAPRAVALLGGLAVVSAVAAWTAAAAPSDPIRWAYAPTRTAIARLEPQLTPGSTVLIRAPTGEFGRLAYPAIAYGLRRHGIRPLVGPAAAEGMGPYYEVTGRRHDASLFLLEGDLPTPKRGRTIARISLPDAPVAPPQRVVRLVLAPGG